MAEKKESKTDEKFTNLLIHEKSPYLLQHAHNPVEWYPWGQAAFKKAREENKPIFLSVGYSTCHWCHVMEHESFEDPSIANLMNKLFVNIKVDREERPDVDKIYMSYIQATEGGGGWPMSVWLTPSLNPISGGTYFPPTDRYGRPGFPTMLKRIADLWKSKQTDIESKTRMVSEQLKEFFGDVKQTSKVPEIEKLEPSVMALGFEQFDHAFDSEEGGFDSQPKFPRPVVLNFMFRVFAFGDDKKAEKKIQERGKKARDMCLQTLDAMAKGGIHDHLGGGFHRYSVTPDWHIPHYEKMLYDQAQLAVSFIEGFQISKNELFAKVAQDILAYTSSSIITSPEGGLFSAEDADSLPPSHKVKSTGKPKKLEGAFYVWEEKEIISLLGDEKAKIFNRIFGVLKNGNAPEGADPHGELEGQNTLIQRDSLKGNEEIIKECKELLFKEREKRPRPHLDDKIITAWNGLMLSAYAKAYQVFGDEKYLTHGVRIASFIRKNLYDESKRTLIRNYRNGPSTIPGFCEDYAFFINGLLDLYEASFDLTWLQWADTLQAKQNELFLSESGGYFNVASGDESLLFRTKEDYDGAEPSYNSITAGNLLRLSHILNKEEYNKQAKTTILAFRDRLSKAPIALPQLAVALNSYVHPPKQIVIVGKADSKDTQKLLQTIHSKFIPNKVLILIDSEQTQKYFSEYSSLFKDLTQKDNKPTAYVCHHFTCSLPVNDPKALEDLL